MHGLRLVRPYRRAAGAADVERGVDRAEVLEHLPQYPLLARRLAAGVHDNGHHGAAGLLGELRAYRGEVLSVEDLLPGALREDQEAVAGLVVETADQFGYADQVTELRSCLG